MASNDSEKRSPFKKFGQDPEPPKRITWLPRENGATAPYAVVGGRAKNGRDLYVIRAIHEGELVPGKLRLGHIRAFIPAGGGEVEKCSYEILTAPKYSTEWKPCSGSDIHPDAIVGGTSATGGKYYIGRAVHEETKICGKVQRSQGVLDCYISYDGQEYSYKNYEILVISEYGKTLFN